MDFLKSVTGKVVSGVVALAVIAGGISWWRTDPAMREMLLNGAGKIASWLGIVLLIPWATFFIVSKVARMESNAAGAALIAGYTILETVLLAWLFQWHMPSATAWTFLLVGGLFAGVYNLFTCDWIAEKVVG
jgi:FtsH-binding integral membrane protein